MTTTLLSCYASSVPILAVAKRLGWRVVEWAGEIPTGHGHPTWEPVAQRLRDHQGRVLPRLRERYRIEGRIVALGFSAGANSGLGQLIQSPADTAELAAIVSLDGLHLFRGRPGEPMVTRWAGRLRAAAQGDLVLAATVSRVATPGPQVTSTWEGWERVLAAADLSLPEMTVSRGADSWEHYAERLAIVWTEGRDKAEHIRHGTALGADVLAWAGERL